MQAVADEDLLIQSLANLASCESSPINYLNTDPTSTLNFFEISTPSINHGLCLHQHDSCDSHVFSSNGGDSASAMGIRTSPANIGWGGTDPSSLGDPKLLPVEGGDPVLDPLEIQSLLDLGLAQLSQAYNTSPITVQDNFSSWASLSESTPALSLLDQPVSGSFSPFDITDSTLASLLSSLTPSTAPNTVAPSPYVPQLSQSDWLSIAAAALAQASSAPIDPGDGSTPPLASSDALLSSCLLPPSPATFQTSPTFSPLDSQFLTLTGGGTENFFAPLPQVVQDAVKPTLTPEQFQALIHAILPPQPVPPVQPPDPPSRSLAGPIRRKRTALPSAEVADGDGEDKDDANERRHACDFPGCTRAFKRLFNLKAHKRTHNPERDRPFSCDVCHATFIRAHDLSRHQPVHTKLKEWSCEQCGKAFTRKDALDRHNANPTACRGKRASAHDGENSIKR